jgi:glutamyl-tRNA(Gln) amidotransferase subunit D
MYSRRIQSVLDRKKIRVGDRVLVHKGKKSYEGLLMPRTDMGDPGSIVIKLDSGYNMGLEFGRGARVEKSRKPEPDDILEEEGYELGRISKKLLKVSFDRSKPPVTLLATGGTIASRVDYRTGGVSAASNPREILHNIPELAGIVNLKMSMPFSKMSEDMDCRDWTEIARQAARRLNSGDRGVIITHGTDTLHFTAAALSFFLQNLHKPVVLVGAQRSSDRGSSDAGMNLICSAHASVSDIAEVGICMHGQLDDSYCLFIRGTKARKMHTSRRDAFRPINELPLAKIWPSGRVEKTGSSWRRRDDKEKVKTDLKFEPRVALLKAYPGSDPGVIDYLAGKGYRGFVIEGTGLGHVPTFAKKSWIETIKKHSKEGIPFVVTPQTLYGRINPNVYTNLRVLYHVAGAIPGEDMLPETAYIKLGWVLGHAMPKSPEKRMAKVREMMLTSYAGEITRRSVPQSFLY